MKKLKIGNRLIGESEPTFIIAEIGINHNGSMVRARELIDKVKEAGADVAKFQVRDLESLYSKKILDNNVQNSLGLQYLLNLLKKFQLTNEQYKSLAQYCKEKDIIFMATPWDIKSVDLLEEIGVPAYKIASADLTNLDLLDRIIETNKPIILSTGMWDEDTVDFMHNYLKDNKAQFALLHCNSTYPAPFKNINLKYLNKLKKYDIPFGYSGHERGIAIAEAAVTLGANIIEKHFTLDRTMEGPDHAASLEFAGLEKLIRDIRNIELALGSEHKFISQGEMINRENLSKSLVAAHNIKKGAIIESSMLESKSPGLGVPPHKKYIFIGEKINKDLEKGEMISEDYISFKSQKTYSFQFPEKWGVPVRYHDYEKFAEILQNPDFFEFHLSYNDVSLNPENFIKTRPQKDILIIHAPELLDNDVLLDLCTPDEKIRNYSISLIKKVIQRASQIKELFQAKKVKIIIHVGGDSLDEFITDENEIKAMYKTLEASLNAIKTPDYIELLPENLPPFPWYFGGQRYINIFLRSNYIRDFCEKTGYNMCFDISHAKLACNLYKIKLENYIRDIKPYITHVHISDSLDLDGEGLQIGQGEINFKRCLKLIDDLDYTFIPEIWQGHKFRGEGMVKALQSLEKIYKNII